MATISIDIDFKVPREIIRAAVRRGTLASASFVKQKSDNLVRTGKWKRPVYARGKSKGKPWTARRPGQLKRSGRADRSIFKNGGAIVAYGTFNSFYGFMHHWGTTNKKSGKVIPENKYLTNAVMLAKNDIEREIAGNIREALGG